MFYITTAADTPLRTYVQDLNMPLHISISHTCNNTSLPSFYKTHVSRSEFPP